ncbi:hypothetical protein [Achromobacter animicus]|uniref:hypothetical protein n=1 Tax=Achromobacter animicus TaxID=1389935 RepID=UPI0028AE7209|nr:hypothetical protein [Achromobacter animicus]
MDMIIVSTVPPKCHVALLADLTVDDPGLSQTAKARRARAGAGLRYYLISVQTGVWCPAAGIDSARLSCAWITRFSLSEQNDQGKSDDEHKRTNVDI